MSEPTLTQQPDGSYLLSGILSFDTVPRLLAQGNALFAHGEVIVDLKAVERSDSAGLALLIEWLRIARLKRQAMKLRNVPPQMQAIARVSDLDTLLPISGE
ncbi:MAG: hypothetical protein A2V90_02115 [Gammaproteobacteria bacterium RBG_16_57_12]|nr:MAG: hypothetical protein A2V90_02115 [Gammaproteobacteria bacterium RBG_16_57_12]